MTPKQPMTPRTYALTPSTTSREIVYTVPANHTAFINVLILTNSDTTLRNMLVEWYDASATTYQTLFDKNIQTKDSTFFDSGGNIVLEAGDQIVVTASVVDQLTCIVTSQELFDPTRN